MKDYDFEGERNRAIFDDFGIAPIGTAPFCEATLAALRRAYFAGQASGGGSDLAHLVTLAAAVESGRTVQMAHAEIAAYAFDLLSALKAQSLTGAKP